MIEEASKNVILCDQTKLGATNRVRFCEIAKLDHLVTDSKASGDQIASFSKRGMDVLI